ncbi:MAG: hypothetical protein MJZ83_01685 [Bacteroidaceae bacterium]|nr:hypothetical protein [Bacteroidaceae bacterium]
MKKYVKPCMYAEEFISNDYVSACYVMNCNISGWFHDDNDNGKYDKNEDYKNGSDKEIEFKAKTKPTISQGNFYKGVNQPSSIVGWIVYIFQYLSKGGESYSNTSVFSPINPGLYIVNNGSKIYGSTQAPYLAPGHPNRS